MSDFVASVFDGRLTKELSQMQTLDKKILILEGEVSWDSNGELRLYRRGRNGGLHFSQSQFLSTLLTMQLEGCWLLVSSNLPTTCEFVLKLRNWSEITNHKILSSRPKPTAEWGFRNNRDWGIHLLQSFPGIGPGVAAAIYDHFKGVPLKWEITPEQLAQVKGVGKKRAEALVAGLRENTNSQHLDSAIAADSPPKFGSDTVYLTLPENLLAPAQPHR